MTYQDPICALCCHPESEHAAFGDWCPNPASEDQLFNYDQKFTSSAPNHAVPQFIPGAERTEASVVEQSGKTGASISEENR